MRCWSRPRPASASTTCSRRWSPTCRRPRAIATRPCRRCWSTPGTTPISASSCCVRVRNGTLRAGQKIRMMATGATYEVDRVGFFTPKLVAADELVPGRDRLHAGQHQGTWPIAGSATRSPTTASRRPRRCPASSRACRWCSAACSRSMRPISRNCASRSPSCGSTIRQLRSTSPRPRLPWGSGSAAASSGCCIWKSCRSG